MTAAPEGDVPANDDAPRGQRMTMRAKSSTQSKKRPAPKTQASRTAATTEPAVRTFPQETRRARSTPGTWLMVIGALGLTAVGLGITIGPDYVNELGWYATKASSVGLEGSSFLVGGAVLMGIAMLARQQRLHAQRSLDPGATEEALAEVGADMAEFRNKLYEFQNDHLHFRTEIEAVRHEVHEHRKADKSGEAKDALFRLAASLDTLHAKLDQSLTRACDGLAHSMHDLSELVEASRDFIQESIEDSGKHNENLTVEMHRIADEVQALGRPHGEDVDDFQDRSEMKCEDGVDEVPTDEELATLPIAEPQGTSLGLLDEIEDDISGECAGWDEDDCVESMNASDEPVAASMDSVDAVGPITQPAPTGGADAPPSLSAPGAPLPSTVSPIADPSLTAASTEHLEPPTFAPSNDPVAVDLEDPQSPLPAPPQPNADSRIDEMETLLREGGTGAPTEGSVDAE